MQRDREARAKQASGKHGLPAALDRVSAEPGYERALAAVLGRDAKAPLGTPSGDAEGRFWTGAEAPAPVPFGLAAHVRDCPAQLAARLALVHVADADDGRALKPGEWLVTRDGRLRRWDGFVARGEGAAEAARLEAENRFAELDAMLPARREAAAGAETAQRTAQDELAELQRTLVAAEREVQQAAEAERQALRALDQAEAARERLAARREELAANEAGLAEQRQQADAELSAAKDKRAALPDPETGRAALTAAQAKHEAARTALQAAAAALAAHDQALAVARERVSAQRADIKGWEARAGDAATRLSGMERRFEEIAEERAVTAAKPAALMREIEGGEAVRERLGTELAAAEAAVAAVGEDARAADKAFAEANEALSAAREVRAGSAARAENEESRREEMARISGERFQCPPPVLAARFAFEPSAVANAGEESAAMDRLMSDRERIGPVNLVAAEELARIEEEHGASTREQAELVEAVNRLRGSIGNLNREGRERLRAAFEEVNEHFKRLFTRLFEGGNAHLALVDLGRPARSRARDLRPAAGQAPPVAHAAVGRRAGVDRGGADLRAVPHQPGADLRARRSRRPARRRQHRPLLRPARRDDPRDPDPLPDRHPQRGDDEPHAPPVRRDHGRARRQPAGQRRPRRGGGAARGRVSPKAGPAPAVTWFSPRSRQSANAR